MLRRTLEIEPNSLLTLATQAEVFAAEGDISTMNRLAERLPVDGRDPVIFNARLRLWIMVRDYPQAIAAVRNLIAREDKSVAPFMGGYRLWLGIAEALTGNAPAANEELTRAREELTALRASGYSGPYLLRQLILVHAFLRDKPAVDQLAAEARPEIENDALTGPTTEIALAIARAQLGETDAAIALVKQLLAKPGENALTPALLRLDPLGDPLRSDPRFQELAEAKP